MSLRNWWRLRGELKEDDSHDQANYNMIYNMALDWVENKQMFSQK